MRPILILLALSCWSAAHSQPRHDGIASWPKIADDGEGGCYSQWRTTQRVLAYAEPRTSSSPIRAVDANRRIDWNDRSESLRVVRALGRIRARRALSLQVIARNPLSGEYETITLAVPAGEVLETMWYAGAEGSDFRMGGVVYRGDVPGEQWVWDAYPQYHADFEVERFPVVENWVLLAPRDGKPAAWLNVTQLGVTATDAYCEGDEVYYEGDSGWD